MNPLDKAQFVRSAASERDFPADGKKHIVLAGRSNVGKSSLINRLSGRKNFAKVSSKPGKTVFVNLFKLESGWMVDLPGYGFSLTSQKERERYSRLVDSYFAKCAQLIACVYLIIDCRRDPMPDDLMMVDFLKTSGIPFVLVSNKIDKLSKSQLLESLGKTREGFSAQNDIIFPVSAMNGQGKDELLAHISKVFSE